MDSVRLGNVLNHGVTMTFKMAMTFSRIVDFNGNRVVEIHG